MSDLVSAIDGSAAAILHATWQAALLAAIVFIVCAALRNRLSARWRAALWMVVLARFVVPVVPASSTSLFNLTGGLDLARQLASRRGRCTGQSTA